jgi:hypothetical protein
MMPTPNNMKYCPGRMSKLTKNIIEKPITINNRPVFEHNGHETIDTPT